MEQDNSSNNFQDIFFQYATVAPCGTPKRQTLHLVKHIPDIFCGVPQSMLKALDVAFLQQLPEYVGEYLKRISRMIRVQAGGVAHIQQVKAESMTAQDLLRWLHDPRSIIGEWHEVIGQDLTMMRAIEMLKQPHGAKRKRDTAEHGFSVAAGPDESQVQEPKKQLVQEVLESATAVQEEEEARDPKRRKTAGPPVDFGSEQSVFSTSVEKHTDLGNGIDNPKDMDKLLSLQLQANPDRPNDPTPILESAPPLLRNRFSVKEVLSLPWPSPRGNLSKDETVFMLQNMKRINTDEDDSGFMLPSPKSYISPLILKELLRQWKWIIQPKDECGCRTCQRRLAEERALEAKVKAEAAERARVQVEAAKKQATEANPYPHNPNPNRGVFIATDPLEATVSVAGPVAQRVPTVLQDYWLQCGDPALYDEDDEDDEMEGFYEGDD